MIVINISQLVKFILKIKFNIFQTNLELFFFTLIETINR